MPRVCKTTELGWFSVFWGVFISWEDNDAHLSTLGELKMHKSDLSPAVTSVTAEHCGPNSVITSKTDKFFLPGFGSRTSQRTSLAVNTVFFFIFPSQHSARHSTVCSALFYGASCNCVFLSLSFPSNRRLKDKG